MLSRSFASWSSKKDDADQNRVIAYFNEGTDTLSNTIKTVVSRLPLFTRHRIIVYAKNGEHTEEAVTELLNVADEVVWLPNIGREGETYLVDLIPLSSGIRLLHKADRIRHI